MDKKPFVVIFFTVFIDLVGFGMIIPLNPFLAREFGATPLQVGLLMTIYSLMQFIFSPFWGGLSDRIGRRPVILVSLLGAGLSHLFFASAQSLVLLFLARGLAGLFGGNISAAMAYIADITKAKDRSKGMGLIGAAFGLGFIFGPFMGGILADVGQRLGSTPPLGGSFPALIASLLCLVNFVFGYFYLRESHPRILNQQTEKIVAPRQPRLQLLARYLSKPKIGDLMLIYFLTSLAMAHMEASLFLYVQDKFFWSMSKASMGFAYVGVIMVFTQGYLIRKTLPMWGEGRSLIIGLSLMAIGLSGIAWASTIPLLAVVITLLAVGNGFVNPSITGAISLLADPDDQGGTMGVNQSLSALGRIIGPALGGLFYQQFGRGIPFLVAGGLAGFAMLLTFRVLPQIPTAGRAAKSGGHG